MLYHASQLGQPQNSVLGQVGKMGLTPTNGSRWCWHKLWNGMSRTTTSSSQPSSLGKVVGPTERGVSSSSKALATRSGVRLRCSLAGPSKGPEQVLHRTSSRCEIHALAAGADVAGGEPDRFRRDAVRCRVALLGITTTGRRGGLM